MSPEPACSPSTTNNAPEARSVRKPADGLTAAAAALPSAGAVTQLATVVCSARGETARHSWRLTIAATLRSWAIVTVLLALVLA
jgi:hypothetical protein